MPKKRRLSTTHKANISRGLKRYYRAKRETAHRRSLAAKRAAVTRKANRELHRLQQKKAVTPAAVEMGRESEEWEVTVKYTVGARSKHHGEVVDVTLRLVGRPGERWTNAQVRAAAWYARKHGAGSLKEFTLEGIDWYNVRRSGATEEYHYGRGDVDEVLENARGMFSTVGIGGLRVALVE